MFKTTIFSRKLSEGHRFQDRFLVFSFWTVVLIVGFPALGSATEESPGEEKPDAKRPDMEAYCGIQSLYRALRALGKDINFSDLVRRDYLSSMQGSTIADLQKAATDFGALAEPKSRMTCAMLRQIDCPVILHVRPDLVTKEYKHWVLYMGTDNGGKARIYDGDKPVVNMDLDELAACWDGSGMLVSLSPINKTGLWLAALYPFFLWGGLTAFAMALLSRLEQRWEGLKQAGPWVGSVRRGLGEALCLLLVSLGAMGGHRFVSDAGFLSSPAAIAAIQDSQLGTFLPKVTIEETARLLDTPGVTVVDARFPSDYDIAHLKGAINIPVGSSPEKCQEALSAVPKQNRILVYSQSRGCPFGAMVSKELIALGYRNIVIVSGGWLKWEESHPHAVQSDQLAKGGH